MVISFVRTLIIYVLIIISVRIMGKRQISELQTTELVATFLISDLAVIPMQNSGQPLTSGFIPIVTLVSLELLFSIFMLKNRGFRKIICGRPVLIINNGEVVQQALKELRMSTEDLFENLRQKDVFDIQEIKYAIIETNGSLSIMKKDIFENPQNKDLGIMEKDEPLNLVVISDGDLCKYSLKLCGLNTDFIKKVLIKEKLSPKEIYIMTATSDGDYNIILKEK